MANTRDKKYSAMHDPQYLNGATAYRNVCRHIQKFNIQNSTGSEMVVNLFYKCNGDGLLKPVEADRISL